MKKIIGKVLMINIVFILVAMIANFNEVKAVLQSNPRTNDEGKSTNSWWWINAIRQMETRNQGMGLEETLNSNLTSSSGSNSIDVHMTKSTEYGIMAILSASTYGRTEKTREITTTTGNATGVYINQNNWEYVAGGWKYYGSQGNFSGIANTYYVNYGNSVAGDALSGFNGWHGASYANWIGVNLGSKPEHVWAGEISSYRDRYISFARGYGGLFSYDYGVMENWAGSNAYYYRNWNSYARASVVVADGI